MRLRKYAFKRFEKSDCGVTIRRDCGIETSRIPEGGKIRDDREKLLQHDMRMEDCSPLNYHLI